MIMEDTKLPSKETERKISGNDDVPKGNTVLPPNGNVWNNGVSAENNAVILPDVDTDQKKNHNIISRKNCNGYTCERPLPHIAY